MSTPTKDFYAKAKYFPYYFLSSIASESEINVMVYVPRCKDKIFHLPGILILDLLCVALVCVLKQRSI